MLASFFMFSKASVQAVETEDVQSGVIFELEEINDGGDVSYNISGVRMDASCETGSVCEIESVVIPDSYNGYPIVKINDGANNIGVFDGIANWNIGKIEGGNNLNSIGKCAFCNLDVDEINIASSVLSISDYAFANSTVKKIYINRYMLASEDVLTDIKVNTFSDIAGDYDIVFKTRTVHGKYSVAEIWDSISSDLTYEITCKFIDGDSILSETKCFYPKNLNKIFNTIFIIRKTVII